MTDFEMLLLHAQRGDADALMGLRDMFHPLLLQQSQINHRFNEDLMQYLILKFMIAVGKFSV